MVAVMRAWVLTDGDADDETRCLGVAEAVADRVERRRVSPRAPWRWLAPFGPIDPRDAPDRSASGPISPRGGWPDVAVAAGRAAAPYLAPLKRASGGRCVTAFLGDTLAGAGVADVVAVTDGSRLRGPNVIASATRPHRLSLARLAAARGGPRIAPVDHEGPRVGVLLGGGPSARRWSREDSGRLAAGLARLAEDDDAILMAVARRETDDGRDMALSDLAHYLWDRQGPDPRVAVMAQADALVVAGDDLLLVDEALSTGLPVMTFRPTRTRRSTALSLDRLAALGAVRTFAGRIERTKRAPIDSTVEIARAVGALVATRAALRPRAGRKAPARKTETNGPTSR